MNYEKEYALSMSIGRFVFEQIKHWDYYSKNSVGIKLQSSADTIAVFIAKSNRNGSPTIEPSFCRYINGAIYETKTWLSKAKERHLIGEDEFNAIAKLLKELHKMINNHLTIC